ncbi:MAG: glycosyltransferase family 4 protein [Candidatus Zixiibacteriota bacterium]
MKVYAESAMVESFAVEDSRTITSPKILVLGTGQENNGKNNDLSEIIYRLLKEKNWTVGFPGQELLTRTGYINFTRKLISTLPRYDVIHFHVDSFRTFIRKILPSLILSKFFGKKIVLSFTSAEIEFYLDRWGRVLRPVILLADKILVPSNYTAEIFNRYGFTADTIPRCIDSRKFSFRARRDLQPRILVNRSLELKNNIPCALQAFRLVKQKYPRAELVIAGEGSLRSDLENIVKADNLSGVYFTGWIRPEKMLGLLNNTDLYLNPSTIDDFPIGIFEAQAAGLPVVTTDAGGILEMVNDQVNALVVPINNPGAVAERIINLIENPALAEKLSYQSRSNAEKYDWSKCVDRLCCLYRDLKH